MAGNSIDDQDAIAAQWESVAGFRGSGGSGAAGRANSSPAPWRWQWAAMVEDRQPRLRRGKNGGERVLSQEEIDNLLGFNVGEVNLDDQFRHPRHHRFAMVSYEASADARIVFDRLVRLMTTSLRNFTSDNVEVSLDRNHSVRFGDY